MEVKKGLFVRPVARTAVGLQGLRIIRGERRRLR